MFCRETSVKVKLFKRTGYHFGFGRKRTSTRVLEDEINEWFEANSRIRIVEIK